MKVGDDDLGSVQHAKEVARQQFSVAVVAVGVVGLKHAQPVADGQPGGDDEEATGEPAAARVAHRVDRLPGDEHGHDGCLAGAGSELEAEAIQTGIRPLVRGSQVFEEATPGCRPGCGLDQPDRGLHRLDLTEKGPDAGRGVVAPVVQQPGRLRRDLPLVRRQLAPGIDDPPQVVDDRRRVVLLAVGVELLGRLVEHELALAALLPGRRDRRDQGDASSLVEDAVRGLSGLVQFPVTARILVGRVQDRLEEELVHAA